jgi:hypothetical protein
VSVIATVIEPHRVTRVFFDCRDAIPDPADRRLIELTVERSIALAESDDDAQETLALGRVTGSSPAPVPSHATVLSVVTPSLCT